MCVCHSHCYSSQLFDSFCVLVSLLFLHVDGFILSTCVTAVLLCWLIHFIYLCHCSSSLLIDSFYVLVSLILLFLLMDLFCVLVSLLFLHVDGFILSTCVTAVLLCWLIHLMCLCHCSSSLLIDSFNVLVSLQFFFVDWFILCACVTHSSVPPDGFILCTGVTAIPPCWWVHFIYLCHCSSSLLIDSFYVLVSLILLFLLMDLFCVLVSLLFLHVDGFILSTCVTAVLLCWLIHLMCLCHCSSSLLIDSFNVLVSLQFFFVDWFILCACVTHSSVPPDGFILCTGVTAIPPCWLIHFIYLCDCNSSWLINTFYILFTCCSSITHSSVPPDGFILCHC